LNVPFWKRRSPAHRLYWGEKDVEEDNEDNEVEEDNNVWRRRITTCGDGGGG